MGGQIGADHRFHPERDMLTIGTEESNQRTIFNVKAVLLSKTPNKDKETELSEHILAPKIQK
jgi:hypothetical protein